MKTLLLKLLMASLFLWTISCGQIELTSVEGMDTSASSALSKVEAAEASVDELIAKHRLLDIGLKKSYAEIIAIIAKTANPFSLARLILDDNTNLEDLIDWVDELVDSINRINSPAVNDQLAEIEALRDAETDPEIKQRYTELLERAEKEHTVTIINTLSLQKSVQSGIRATQKAQEFMISKNIWVAAFFVIFAPDVYGKAIDLEIALEYLDINLEKINKE